MNGLSGRIIRIILLLLIFRIGTFIPLPGINAVVLEELMGANSGGILGMFNMFTGGALGRMSIFSLNIMPYITASILMQLLGIAFKEIGDLKKEGEPGRKKIAQYTRYIAILLAAFQGYGMVLAAEKMKAASGNLVEDPGTFFRAIATLTIVGGTVLVIWMTDQMSKQGFGNGTSLIIFSGIVAGLPGAITTMFEMGKSGAMSTSAILMIVLLCFGLIALIIFFERSHKKVPVHYPRRQAMNRSYSGQKAHIPLKLNTSGVLAPIFASSLLLFPATIINFIGGESTPGTIRYNILMYLGHGKPLYILLYVVLIFCFSFFYTGIIFNSEETAENLKKSGAVVSGLRPGSQTARFFTDTLFRLNIVGAAYLSFICIVPELLISHYAVPFYLGGTSLLIVINVIIELFEQIQTHMLDSKYSNLMKSNGIFGKVKGGRKSR